MQEQTARFAAECRISDVAEVLRLTLAMRANGAVCAASIQWLVLALSSGVAADEETPPLRLKRQRPLSVNVRRDAHHRGINDLEGENGERRTCRRTRTELEQRLRLLPPAAKTSER
jgi:hypothetical protein